MLYMISSRSVTDGISLSVSKSVKTGLQQFGMFIHISYNVPFNFILIHFAFNRRRSCVFNPWNLVLRFPVPWILPMRFGPVFSSPVFSTPAIWCHVFQSCVFHPRIFHGPAFSSSAFSASPIFARNFAKCSPILKILLPANWVIHFKEVIHHSLNAWPCYLVICH